MIHANSTERVLALLGLFTEDRLEWTPDEMMAALGYSRPTLYRYLKALKEAGLLAPAPKAGFSLGPRIVELDFLLRKSDPLLLFGQPALHRLAALLPSSALIVRWFRDRLLCVASECSAENPISSYPRGRPMPLARGAISRAIMAFLPRRQLMPLVEANLAELAALGLGDTAEAIVEALREVRRAGYAVARGEVTPGVIGLAAPLFDTGEAPVAALAVTVAASDLPEADLPALAAAVRAEANGVTEALAARRA